MRETRITNSGSRAHYSDLTGRISIVSHGVRIGIATDAPEILDSFLEQLPSGCKLSSSLAVQRSYSVVSASNRRLPAKAHRFTVYAGSLELTRRQKLDSALDALETDLEHYVAEMSRQRVFVHSGVVGWQGLGVLIPGRSFAGKSTLVAELVRSGAIYYSDEYAVLDSRGRVHPFSRPLGIREGDNWRPTKYPVEALGGQAGVKPLPVALVISSRYVEGSSWQPRRISAGHGALELLANTVPARRQPERSMATLQQAASRAHFFKGNRGEANELAEWIFAFVEGLASQNHIPELSGGSHSGRLSPPA